MSTASAAGPLDNLVKPINPLSVLDAITTSDIPAEYAAQFPTTKDQLGGLSRLNELRQLTQLTGQAAPVLNLVPVVE